MKITLVKHTLYLHNVQAVNAQKHRIHKHNLKPRLNLRLRLKIQTFVRVPFFGR